MKTKHRSFIYLGMPVGAAIALLLALFFALPGGVAASGMDAATQQLQSPTTPPTELFFSEYVEGSGNNKALEIYNGTGGSVDLSTYTIELYYNGNTSVGATISLSGSLAPGDVFVVVHSSADAALLNLADLTTGSLSFNGDDAVVLKNGATVADSIGQVGYDPGSEWGTDATSTRDNTIRRLATVCQGDTNTGDVFDPSVEWVGYPQDTFDGIGTHTVSCGAAAGLTISKTGDAVVMPGDDLVYTVTVSSQMMTVTNVIVTDTLPLSVTFDSASLPYGNPAAGVYTFSLGPIVSGTQSTFNITVTTDAGITGTVTLTNTADVIGTKENSTDVYTATATFNSSVHPLVSIHAIQYVNDPGSADASPYQSRTVFVEGIVTAAPGELGSRAMVIETAGGGAWSGLYVYDSGNFPGVSVSRGDEVRVLGTVAERYGMTALVFDSLTVLSTGNTIPGPDLVNTGGFTSAATAEQWESVYIQFEDATVTGLLNFGEWEFNDGSGTARADDLGSFTYTPAVGDYYDFIRGIGWYSYSNYKLEPRDDADISLGTPANDLGVTKGGPQYAIAGDTISYTIRVHNPLLVPVADVVLTDTLPISVTNVVSASNALTATHSGNQIVWEFGDIPAGVTETVHLTVTTPAAVSNGFVLTNRAVVSTTSVDDFANNSAAVNTTLYPLVPIATARAGNDGDTFAVEGQVIVAPGTYNFTEWALQDSSGGIAVYDYPPPAVSLSDTVRLIGTRGTHNGQEQFSDILSLALVSGGPEVTPLITDTGIIDAGQAEGWLVQVEGTISGLDCPGDHNFSVDDGSGAVFVYVDADTGADMCSLGTRNGDTVIVTGFSTEYNGTFEIKPRRPADLALLRNAPEISKAAPPNVDPGATLPYTITIENYTGSELTHLVITDTVPANVSGITPADGGVYANGVITWVVASLSDQGTVDVHFSATAPVTVGTAIINAQYGFTATEWLTPTFGTPVYTFVGDYTPIYTIQGDGMRSEWVGQMATTRGVVTGIFEGNFPSGNFDGFFIQDANGDGDPNTSDAIFINIGTSNPTISVGQLVEVTGEVQEFAEWDAACSGDACLTQIAVDPDDIAVLGTGTVSATILTPLGDPISGTLYYESLEGMLVTFPSTTTVVGPTNYGTIRVIPGSLGVDHALRNSPYEGMPVGVRPYQRYGSGAPNLIVGSQVSGVDGPLTFTYGDYVIVEQDGYAVDYNMPLPAEAPSWPAATPIQFSAATMNTYNFDDDDPAVKTTKFISQVVQMNGPTFLALQEIESPAVLPGLVADLAAAGYAYDYAYSHIDIGNHGVALLWRTDLVTNVITSTAYQDCSPYGSPSSNYDPMWATCQAQGEYPLFSRRPVVLTGTVNLAAGPQQVVVIANHFKSKRGGTSADMRRLEQGQFVNALAARLEQAVPYVLMMGDLNDFEDSAPLQALYTGEVFTNTWYTLPADQRYSYNYLGVSQILDHILASPALVDALVGVSPMHFNADFPFRPYSSDGTNLWHNSDHDPVIATFQIEITYQVYLPLVSKNSGN